MNQSHKYEIMKEEKLSPKTEISGEEVSALQLKLETNKKKMDAMILHSLDPYVPEINYSIESIAWNYNDTKIAVACYGEKIIVLDHEFKIIDRIDEYKEGKISWHSKKNILAFLGSNNCIKFYEFENKKINKQVPFEKGEEAKNSFFIDWHPHEDLVAFHAGGQNQIKICNMSKVTLFFGIETDCKDLKWNMTGDKIAYSSANTLVIMNYYDNTFTQYFKITENETKIVINNIIWSSNNNQKICFLSASGSNQRIKIWNIEEEVEENNFGSIFSNIVSIDWSSDEKYVATGTIDKTISIWDVKNSVELFSKKIPTEINEKNKENILVKWNHSASTLISYTKKKIIPNIWREKLNYESIVIPFNEKVEKSIWNSNGSRLLVCFNRTFKIWDFESHVVQHFRSLDSDIIDTIWNNTYTELVCFTDEEIYYQDFAKEEPKKIQYDNENSIHLLRYNHDCSFIAGAGDKVIEIWPARFKQDNFNSEFHFQAHSRNIIDVRWNKDGTKLLSASNDETVKLWELDLVLKKEKKILEIKKHGGAVNCVMWDESEDHIISVGKDQYIRIFSSANGKELKLIKTHDENIKYLGWFKIFDENFLIYLHSSESSFHLIDPKTGLQIRNINLKSNGKQDNIPIRHFDYNKFNRKTAVSSGNNVLIYDNQEIWKDFEANEYYYFLIEFLPKRLSIKLEYSNLIEKIINNYFFKEAPSAFHILCIHKKIDEFDKLIQFCIKQKIFSKRFFDSDEAPLLNLLNSNMPPDSINLFFDFVIQSDVPLGNLFKVTFKELSDYTKKNSFKACQFLESRFKIIENYELDAEWPSDDAKNSTGLTKTLNLKDKSDFSQAFGDLVDLKTTINDSSKRPYFKILDIPVVEVSLDYISSFSESSSFDEFCQSSVIISILNLLWYKGVLTEFYKKNILYFVYFLILILNSIIVLPGFLSEIERAEDNNGDYRIAFLSLSVELVCLLRIMFARDIIEWIRLKNAYFRSFWNYIDFANIFFSLGCVVFNIIVLSGNTDELGLLRIFHSLCFFFSMVRIFDFFRAFRETCFLIQIVLQVVYDMRIFFILMMIFVSTFSLSSTK